MTEKKKGLSREQAAELYRDLQKALETLKSRARTSPGGGGAPFPMAAMQAMAQQQQPVPSMLSAPVMPSSRNAERRMNMGHAMALAVVVTLGCARVVLSGLEAFGVVTVPAAQASQVARSPIVQLAPEIPGTFTKDEVRLLSKLDERRQELEQRSTKLDEREKDIARRDREFATRVVEIRELTEKLKVDREKTEKRRGTQLEQLANVYGAMNPEEAARLIEQLDTTIALGLIQKMPEKRIGQILALMNPEKALILTKLLSAG